MRNVPKPTAARLLKTLTLAAAFTFAFAGAAFAGDNGQGVYGDIDDKIVTFFGLGLIVLFPLIALIGSSIQGRLERRADERKAAIFKKK